MAVRVAPEVQQNMDYGLNVVEWVQEGMIDLVTVAGRFESNDSDMPIKLWSTLLKPHGVELAAGIEGNILPHFGRRPFPWDNETIAACAATAYSQGADKIYMYNFFHCFQAPRIDTVIPDITVNEGDTKYKSSFYNTFGDFEKVLKLDRRHIWSVNDRLAPWYRNRSGMTQLPVTFARSISFKITVGEIPSGAKMSINIGFDDTEKAAANPPKLFVNSEECTYTGTMKYARAEKGTVLCYDVPPSAHKSNVYVFPIVNEQTTVNYLEAYIKATK